jgi:hypothetical protein
LKVDFQEPVIPFAKINGKGSFWFQNNKYQNIQNAIYNKNSPVSSLYNIFKKFNTSSISTVFSVFKVGIQSCIILDKEFHCLSVIKYHL